MSREVLVTGGCGYIGTRLVPEMVARGYRVRVLDLLLFGNNLPEEVQSSPQLDVVRGDIRSPEVVAAALAGVDTVVHLAALANDPSADMDPEVTRQINSEAVVQLVDMAKRTGVRRFVNASTATVYGVRSEPDVDEEFEHRPITLYGKYKSETDRYVAAAADDRFTTVSLRAATVCGWSPRMRLDLTVNILTYHAVRHGRITVFGGGQMRPNIVIDDLVRAYLTLVEAPADAVNGEAFNVGAENHTVLEIAHAIRDAVSPGVDVVVEPQVDHRSYHISAKKIRDRLGFVPQFDIRRAARQLAEQIRAGAVGDGESSVYRNIEHLKRIDFK